MIAKGQDPVYLFISSLLNDTVCNSDSKESNENIIMNTDE